MKRDKPIQSNREYAQAFDYCVKTAMTTLGIDRKESEKRTRALLKSGILEEGSWNDKYTQLRMENFLRFDLSKLDYTDVFYATMNFPALVAEYDKKENRHLAKALVDIKKDDYDFQDVRDQIELFDKFYCKNIWNYFPGVEKFGNIHTASIGKGERGK